MEIPEILEAQELQVPLEVRVLKERQVFLVVTVLVVTATTDDLEALVLWD